MKPNTISRRSILLAARLLLVGVLVWPIGGVAQAASDTVFSGRATALQIDTFLTQPVTVADTGPIDVRGGKLETALLCYPTGPNCTVTSPAGDPTNGAVTAEVLHAAVVARGDSSRAEASVANFSLREAGVQISAELLRAEARATCTASGAVVQAGADTSVAINGTTYTVGANETKTVQLPVGFVVINEGASGPKSGNTIDASALHVVIPGTLDVTVAAVHADITCGSLLNCPGRNDFVTGGGFINPAGTKLHFAVAGMDGAAWGHVLWKPTGLHVKNPFSLVFDRTFNALETDLGTQPEFTAAQAMLSTLQANASSFQGAAILYWTNDGQSSGTVVGEVLAIDMGEPGKGKDFFEIVGVDATNRLVSLGGGLLNGGNIQMHGKCPS